MGAGGEGGGGGGLSQAAKLALGLVFGLGGGLVLLGTLFVLGRREMARRYRARVMTAMGLTGVK